jgi:hypothetical protein
MRAHKSSAVPRGIRLLRESSGLGAIVGKNFPNTKKLEGVFAVSPFFDTGEATFATDLRKAFHDFSNCGS